MNKEKLLVVLEDEMLLTQARALGAKKAWQEAKKSSIWASLTERGIYNSSVVEVLYTGGERGRFTNLEVSFSYMDERPVLLGVKLLKNGKASKVGMVYVSNVVEDFSFITCIKE